MSNRLTTTKADCNNLFDNLLRRAGLKNDGALARALEVAPPVISKLRHQRLPFGPSMMIRIHDAFDVTLDEIRRLAGIEVHKGTAAR
jgi:plasmid maintenance system antidote protein VapI